MCFRFKGFYLALAGHVPGFFGSAQFQRQAWCVQGNKYIIEVIKTMLSSCEFSDHVWLLFSRYCAGCGGIS